MKFQIKELISAKVNSALRSSEMSVESGFFLEMNSENILTIKGCKDIKLYTDNEIIVDCAIKTIIISGSGLYISVFDNDCTSVAGNINNVQFINRKL